MKKILTAVLALSMLATACACAAPATTDNAGNREGKAISLSENTATSVAAKDVVLNENHLDMTIGEKQTLQATVSPSNAADKTVEWTSGNTAVLTVSESGEITAVEEGMTTVTATIANGQRDVCQVRVRRAVQDDGLEMQEDGYIYYEDFSQRSGVPSYLMDDVNGTGRAEIEEGALCITVVNGDDSAFLTYAFDEPLQAGQYTVEARIKADSNVFANPLFFFRETNDLYDTKSIVTQVAMQSGYFKNNTGSGWGEGSYIAAYETGCWYNVRMVIDMDAEVYDFYIDGMLAGDSLAFRNPGNAIKYLRFGSENEWADFSIEYIRVRETVAEDNESAFEYEQNFDGVAKPSDMNYTNGAGGSADFSADGYMTVQTPTSGTVSVTKKFNAALSGVVATEVRFKNESSVEDTFANVLFLGNSSLSGTSSYIVTVAVETGRLRYHNGKSWTNSEILYDGNPVYLIDDAWYTLRAVNDYTNHTMQLYLAGESYLTELGGTPVTIPDGEIYLGEYGFRNATIGNPDVFEMAIGTGKDGTKFTVDYFKFYSVTE